MVRAISLAFILVSSASGLAPLGRRNAFARSSASIPASHPLEGRIGDATSRPHFGATTSTTRKENEEHFTARTHMESSLSSTTSADLTARSGVSLWQRIGSRIPSRFSSSEKSGKTPLRERLSKMGVPFVLAYVFVSNCNLIAVISTSWYAFAHKTGMSPIAPGQWSGFTGVFASIYLVSNLLRPVRLAAALALRSKFDAGIAAIQRRTNASKPVAISLVALVVHVLGSLLMTGAGVSLASVASGVAIIS